MFRGMETVKGRVAAMDKQIIFKRKTLVDKWLIHARNRSGDKREKPTKSQLTHLARVSHVLNY